MYVLLVNTCISFVCSFNREKHPTPAEDTCKDYECIPVNNLIPYLSSEIHEVVVCTVIPCCRQVVDLVLIISVKRRIDCKVVRIELISLSND